MRVALLVRNAGLSTEAVAGAVLHDAVEDTLVLLQLIGDLFGGRVRDIVFGTSAISRPEDGNRRTRKEIDRKHYASGDYEVQTIKIADFVDNAPSMISGNPEFASVWMEEKRMMLESFTSYEPTLMEQAASILADFDRSRESSSRPVLS
jgi:(p)ppGpp synthase/HD superfamily hydrolase